MRKFRQFLVIILAALLLCVNVPAPSPVTVARTVYPEKITLNHKVYTLKKGKKLTLQKTIFPSDSTKKRVYWKSSKRSVARVSKKGVVTARRRGKATITVTVKGTRIRTSCKIIVGTPVSRVRMNKTTAALDKGKTLQLRATVSPSNATTKTVSWKSLNKNVASVSSKGLVTGLKKGKAVITAITKDGTGKSAICIVTVTEPEKTSAADSTQVSAPAQANETSKVTTPAKDTEASNQKIKVTELSFAKTTLQLAVGETAVNVANILPANATNKNLSYSCDNTEIATVAENGAVTGLKIGTATITAKTTDGTGITASYTVKVLSKNAKCIVNMIAWAKKYADNDAYGYKKWTSDKNTHLCAVCYPDSGLGWNCVGYVSAILFHGGKVQSIACSNSGILTDSWAAFDALTLTKWKTRNGASWKQVAKAEEKVDESLLKAGDIVICYTNKVYKHVLMYAGDGYLYDATSTLGIMKRKYSSVKYTMMIVYRYTGS